MGLINAPYFIMAKTKKSEIKTWCVDYMSAKHMFTAIKHKSGTVNVSMFLHDELLEAHGFAKDQRPKNY